MIGGCGPCLRFGLGFGLGTLEVPRFRSWITGCPTTALARIAIRADELRRPECRALATRPKRGHAPLAFRRPQRLLHTKHATCDSDPVPRAQSPGHLVSCAHCAGLCDLTIQTSLRVEPLQSIVAQINKTHALR